MAQQFNLLPNFGVALAKAGVTTKDWYLFWANLFSGLPPGNETALTIGASPYTYTAGVKGSLIVSGGTVSAIAFSRDGTTFYSTGQTAGMFTLNARDSLRVTYTVLPTVTFVPT
jgi:hypothetical protein